MSDMKRLGPQDPLSWIRDTRDKVSELQDVKKTAPVERKIFRIQSEGETPIEITVVIKGEQEDRTICIKVAEEGKKATKIEVKTCERQNESPHPDLKAS